jgi:hypothetical protein
LLSTTASNPPTERTALSTGAMLRAAVISGSLALLMSGSLGSVIVYMPDLLGFYCSEVSLSREFLVI